MSDHLKVPVADFDPQGIYPKDKRHIGYASYNRKIATVGRDFYHYSTLWDVCRRKHPDWLMVNAPAKLSGMPKTKGPWL